MPWVPTRIGTNWEGGIRTPGFLFAPSIYPSLQGKVYPHMFHVTDWGPTLLRIISHPSAKSFEESVDGMEFHSTFLGWDGLCEKSNSNKQCSNPPVKRDELIVDSNQWRNVSTFFSGDYKLSLGFVFSLPFQIFLSFSFSFSFFFARRASFEFISYFPGTLP